MKQRVNQYDFEQAFRSHGRFGGDNDNFSYEALQLLFEYFEELEDSCDTEIELDVIAICCDYCEMTRAEIISSYDCEDKLLLLERPQNNQEDITPESVEEWLSNRTSYVGKTVPLFPTSSQSINATTYVFQSF